MVLAVIFLVVCVRPHVAERNKDELFQLHVTGSEQADVGESTDSCGKNGNAVATDQCGLCCGCTADEKVEFLPATIDQNDFWDWTKTQCGTGMNTTCSSGWNKNSKERMPMSKCKW